MIPVWIFKMLNKLPSQQRCQPGALPKSSTTPGPSQVSDGIIFSAFGKLVPVVAPKAQCIRRFYDFFSTLSWNFAGTCLTRRLYQP